jgi:glycosyltransferase involved in cell wall biosynthesis
VHGLCKALVRAGHEVHVFTTDRDGPGSLDVPTERPVDVDGVQVWYFRSRYLRRLFWAPGLAASLAEQIDSFDLLHLHSIYLWPTAVAARIARRHRVPYVMAPRGMLVQELISRKSSWVKRAWISLVERRNLAGAAGVHFTTRLEREEALKIGLCVPESFVIPNGIDASMKAADRATSLPCCASATGERMLLFIGRLNWKKGLDRLIQALAGVPNCRLVIAGNDEEDYLPRLQALAFEYGVADRISFPGPVYGDQKAALLAKAHMLVLPSYSENFGNVVVEAMAEGVPVAVTADVGAAEIVLEAHAGIVVDGEPDRLAASLADALSKPDLLREMGNRGKRAVYSRYTWDAVARDTAAMYRVILGHARSGVGEPVC